MNARMKSYFVTGIFLAAFSQSIFAEPAHLWIPLNSADGSLAVDYYSIQLQGAAPTVSIKQKFIKSMVSGNNSYNAILHQYSIDCVNQVLVRSTSRIFDEPTDSGTSVEIQPGSGNDRVPLGQLKSICLWREHGFTVPDIGIKGDWEEMDSPISTDKVFEAPNKRQRNNGLVLIKQKNEDTPNISVAGSPSHYGILVSAYDCVKQEAHTTIVVRYDLALKPIAGEFYREGSAMPKIEANRDRFASTCQ
jgi:hypothetical protein